MECVIAYLVSDGLRIVPSMHEREGYHELTFSGHPTQFLFKCDIKPSRLLYLSLLLQLSSRRRQ